MKPHIKNLSLLSVLMVGLGLMQAGQVTAQTFTTLYSFTATHLNNFNRAVNADGAGPVGPLILAGGTFYGVAYEGGSYGSGTVFAINTDGTGFSTLYSFASWANSPPYTNEDGAIPRGGLTLSGKTLYGTTSTGGSSGSGTI